MTHRKPAVTAVVALALACAAIAWVRPAPDGMHMGPVNARSLGQMAFGPNNVLFIGDNEGAAIHAVQIDDGRPSGAGRARSTSTPSTRRSRMVLGATARDIAIEDMVVHPASHNVYLTVRRGSGADKKWALLKVTHSATKPIEEVSLDNVKFSSAPIANAPASSATARTDPRTNTITDLAYADGRVWIAGLSNEEFSSSFRQITYPFNASLETTSLQIYHVSHKRSETQAPVMAFLPKKIDGKLYILAAYTCTPLVTFEVGTLKNGEKVVGRTVAELGAGNQPAGMVSFSRDGKDVVLVAKPAARDDEAQRRRFCDRDVADDLRHGYGHRAHERIAPGAIQKLADLDKDNVVVIQKSATVSTSSRSPSRRSSLAPYPRVGR